VLFVLKVVGNFVKRKNHLKRVKIISKESKHAIIYKENSLF